MDTHALREHLLAMVADAAKGPNWKTRTQAVVTDAWAFVKHGRLTAEDAGAIQQAAHAVDQTKANNRERRTGHRGGGMLSLATEYGRVVGKLRPVEPSAPTLEPKQIPAFRRDVQPLDPGELAKRRFRWEIQRELAQAARVPAKVAAKYTRGQVAVLGWILFEICNRGFCELSVCHISNLTKCGRTLVQSTLRRALLREDLAVEYRERATSRITIRNSRILSYIQKWSEGKKSQYLECFTEPERGSQSRAHPQGQPVQEPQEASVAVQALPEPERASAAPEPTSCPQPAIHPQPKKVRGFDEKLDAIVARVRASARFKVDFEDDDERLLGGSAVLRPG